MLLLLRVEVIQQQRPMEELAMQKSGLYVQLVLVIALMVRGVLEFKIR